MRTRRDVDGMRMPVPRSAGHSCATGFENAAATVATVANRWPARAVEAGGASFGEQVGSDARRDGQDDGVGTQRFGVVGEVHGIPAVRRGRRGHRASQPNIGATDGGEAVRQRAQPAGPGRRMPSGRRSGGRRRPSARGSASDAPAPRRRAGGSRRPGSSGGCPRCAGRRASGRPVGRRPRGRNGCIRSRGPIRPKRGPGRLASNGSAAARARPHGLRIPERTTGPSRVGPYGPTPAGSRRRPCRVPSQVPPGPDRTAAERRSSSASSRGSPGAPRCTASAPTSTGMPANGTVWTCPPVRSDASSTTVGTPRSPPAPGRRPPSDAGPKTTARRPAGGCGAPLDLWWAS